MESNGLKKIHVKTLDNLTDKEINILIDGLKKIKGFKFTISNFLFVTILFLHIILTIITQAIL
jgi:hypothetical protein